MPDHHVYPVSSDRQAQIRSAFGAAVADAAAALASPDQTVYDALAIASVSQFEGPEALLRSAGMASLMAQALLREVSQWIDSAEDCGLRAPAIAILHARRRTLDGLAEAIRAWGAAR